MQYALDHPYMIDSMFAIGTPFFGSSSAATILGKEFATEEGRNDIINRSKYLGYYNDWMVGFDNYYSRIKAHAIGGYSDTDFALDRIIESDMDTQLSDFAKNLKWGIKGLSFLAAPTVYIAKLANELVKFYRFEGYVESELEALLIEILSEISYFDSNDANDSEWKVFVRLLPLIGCPIFNNDLLVNLSSQLGFDDYSAGNNAYNFKTYVKKFTEDNYDAGRTAISNMPAIVHNLEPRDKDMIDYIIRNIDLGTFQSNYIYEELVDGTISIVGYNGNIVGNEFRIPEMIDNKIVSRISSYAFSEFFNNCDINTVVIPSSVKEIGEGAFYGNENLTTIEIVPSTSSS